MFEFSDRALICVYCSYSSKLSLNHRFKTLDPHAGYFIYLSVLFESNYFL